MFWIFGWPPRTWGNLPEVTPSPGLWIRFFYQFPFQRPGPLVPNIDWGAFGVAIFFLLSGFLIANSVRSYRPSEFLINRILRIYPTYAVGFAIVLLAHLIAGSMYGRGISYTALQMFTHAFPGIRQAFNSAYIDPIIWTLEVEIKFYLVVFVAILIAPTGIKLRAASIGAGIGLATLMMYLAASALSAKDSQFLQLLSDAQFVSYIFIGAVFFDFWAGDCSRLELCTRAGMIFSVFALAWMVAEREGIAVQSLERIWSYAFAVAVFALSMRFSDWFEVKNGVADFYAKISYPLYVVHLASGYLILFLLHETALPIVVDIAAAFGASTLIAFILHVGIEAPTMAIARLYRRKAAEDVNLLV